MPSEIGSTTITGNDSSNIINEKIRRSVIKKLNPRNITKGNTFINCNLEYEQIHTLLENTFKLREGKSALIIGPRGVGKTVLVERALYDLEHNKKYDFFTIRLNGSFFKDDTSAIKEIARQLDWYLEKYNPSERENLKKATFEQKTVTNTMNVIIEILDRTRLNEDDEEKNDLKSYVENNDKTKRRKKNSFFIPIIFIIDEIDRYTHSAKQTLLYNLFDMAQSSSSKTGGDSADYGSGTTISVIGISTKTTVREQLEKRVKSRFSQRIIQINKVRELEEFCKCVYNMVYFEDEEIKKCEEGNDYLFKKAAEKFNENMKKMIFEKGKLRRLIVENFYSIRDLNALRNELIVYIMNNFSELKYDHLKDYKNRNIEVMKTLSETELKMLISCIRAKIKNNVLQINFDMAFNEYSKMVLSERRDIQARIQVIGMSLTDNEGGYLLNRDAIQICWERLCDIGLLERQPMSFYGNTSSVNTNRNNSRKDENGRVIRNPANSILKYNQSVVSSNVKSAIGSAVGSITPGGVAVCGVELDDIDPTIFIRDGVHATETVSWGWLETWKRVAQ